MTRLFAVAVICSAGISPAFLATKEEMNGRAPLATKNLCGSPLRGATLEGAGIRASAPEVRSHLFQPMPAIYVTPRLLSPRRSSNQAFRNFTFDEGSLYFSP
jgi:hypothetical protein